MGMERELARVFEDDLATKQKLYQLLYGHTITVLPMMLGASIYVHGRKVTVPVTTYYNKKLKEITEDNMSSFQKVTLKYTLGKDVIAEMKNAGYTMWDQMTCIASDDAGRYYGVVFKDKFEKEKFPEESITYKVEITFS